MPVYDATFANGAGVNDFPLYLMGTSGLWTSQPAGHWSVPSGTMLVGTPASSDPSFLTRPSAEPRPSYPWGSSQAAIALTPPGGWGSSATAWGLALCWSKPGSDPSQAVYYLFEARPSQVSGRPNTLTISKVEAGVSTVIGSPVAWPNDSTHDYDLIFEAWCEYLGSPVNLFASAIDRATPAPTMHDTNHDLQYGPSGVTVLALTDAAPGLSNGLIGCPALVALPGTAGASFNRVRLYNTAPSRTFSGFGPRPVGEGWSIGADGSIVAEPGGLVLPL
jgi:hypothetical protein